jgi:branched-chain amino acid aminotransferase
MQIPVVERPVDKTELFIADEVFLTGTAAKITPIRQIESTQMNTDRPVMTALKTRLVSITEGRDTAYEHWVTRIPIA